MSEGPRITLENAKRVGRVLVERWGIGERTPAGDYASLFVGSVRRRCPTVGDIEIVAPAPLHARPSVGDDPLFARINATIDNPWSEPGLFGTPAPPPCANPVGSATRGFKPGFLEARFSLRPWPGFMIACQVFRYTPRNRGWVILMRTGPGEFGKWFLGQWKKRYSIPMGTDEDRGSRDGHLVDAAGNIVDVPAEAAAFDLAGVPWVPPERRDQFMVERQALRETYR